MPAPTSTSAETAKKVTSPPPSSSSAKPLSTVSAKAASPESSKSSTNGAKAPEPTPAAVVEEEEEDDEAAAAESGEIIDMEIFEQILELDEEGEYEFSWEMIQTFFSQAESTFKDMDEAYVKKDLPQLHRLGHFLKGSSAALGVQRVQDTCEKMQHYGEKRDEEKKVALSEAEALELIKKSLKIVKADFAAAKKWFLKWFIDHGYEPASEYGK